jgi:SAM-dependent methyltransferase
VSVYCTHDNRRLILNLGETPLADAFPAQPTDEQPCYPLRLTVCERCYVVELTHQVADDVLFGTDYGFFSGTSPALVRHFDEYARWARSTFHFPAAVIEIACNDGTLLRHFDDGHTLVIGVDPAGPATELARERGLNVVTALFTRDYATELVPGLPSNRLIIANNVIAHVPDLDDFVAGLSLLVGDDGAGVLEFQYLPDLLVGTQFDLVYHEHRRFLSLSALLPVLNHHGLDVVHARSVDTQGGSVRIVVRRSRSQVPTLPTLWHLEEWVRRLDAYTSLQGRVTYLRGQLLQLLQRQHDEDRRLALYGAPAKATTLLHYLGVTHNEFDYAVDLTPTKIGRYVPGTDVPIISPEQEHALGNDRADTYLLAVANYASSVLRRERDFVDGGGRFIVTTPRPVVL